MVLETSSMVEAGLDETKYRCGRCHDALVDEVDPVVLNLTHADLACSEHLSQPGRGLPLVIDGLTSLVNLYQDPTFSEIVPHILESLVVVESLSEVVPGRASKKQAFHLSKPGASQAAAACGVIAEMVVAESDATTVAFPDSQGWAVLAHD